MKKSLIAVAGASLAAAAMPVVGVFAAESQVIDTVKVTISDSCTIVNNSDSVTPAQPGDPGTSTSVENGTQVVRNTYAVAMALGELKSGIGGPGAGNGAAPQPGQGGGQGDPSATGGSVSVVCNGDVQPSIDADDAVNPSEGAGSWKLTALAGNANGWMEGPDSAHIATGTATSGAGPGRPFSSLPPRKAGRPPRPRKAPTSVLCASCPGSTVRLPTLI